MRKVLILLAHPRFEHSVTNKLLMKELATFSEDQVMVHDLYEAYPDYDIDIQYEQELLLMHDIIIWQHPFYWYSCPPLMKQWIDLVLEYNWAYGPKGNYLRNKVVFNAITTGGGSPAYQAEGLNRFSLKQFLVPFEQTARLCKMIYLPPFAVMGTNKLNMDEITQQAHAYRQLLEGFVNNELDFTEYMDKERLNDDRIILKP